ncbi:MAG TPA: tripartite tricarboxylate transporter substrate binding protein [Methylomirabilota bacterium]|jgi:tripartite-type tricarboxylate transporter receptor subunit TctC|nr:tripartite tricarboxylate transporter substrate binding protein [Methylomirabilota bacterium]
MPARRALLLTTVGLLLAHSSVLAAAESYPTKPVRLIVPFPPGGSNDIVGRMIAAQLGERLGKQVIVDNRGGAGGLIGTEIAAKSPPDGHTLLLVSVAYTFNPSLYKQLPYDPIKSFVPVAMLGTGPVALAVFPGLPVNSVKDLVALARERPGKLYAATAGPGTFQHLASELFRIQAGIDIVQVPFKGGGPATIDVIAGNTQISIGSLIQMLPHVRSGRLKVLATGGSRRSAALPEVPTIAEAGVPGYDANNWWGILAPAGTPPAIVGRLHKELSVILGSAETQKRFEVEGAEAVRMDPSEFGRFIAAEILKWARVVKEAGISLQP